MRYLYLYLLSFLTFFFTSAIAQDAFQRGYIITLQNDTLIGFVRAAPAKTPVKVCEFRTSESNNPVQHHPGTITGFGYLDDDRYFQSFEVPGNDKQEKVFAELLLKGRADLFWYDEFFYIQKDTTREIIDKVSTRESHAGGGRYVYTHKIFIGTLNRYFYDCLPPKLLKGDVMYTERDFVDIFKKYSECAGVPFYVYKQRAPKGKISFHLLAGFNNSSIRFQKADLDVFSADNNFFIGAGMNLPLSLLGDNVFLTGDILYHRAIYSGRREGFTPTGAVMKDYTIDLAVVKVPVGVKLNFSKKPFTPYIKAGLTPFLPIKAKWTIEYNGRTEGDFDIDEKTASLVYWGSLGFERKLMGTKRAFVELRIEKFIDYIGFHGPEGATNIPSTVINKMLVCGYSF